MASPRSTDRENPQADRERDARRHSFALCLAPVKAAVEIPFLAIPVILAWLLLLRLAPRWAVPAAILGNFGYNAPVRSESRVYKSGR